MAKQTTPEQRRSFYRQHQKGDTYQDIAEAWGVSKECVRYWCRRQRDGGRCATVYRRPAAGILSSFDPKVRYVILRLRLAHPRWGPDRIRYHLSKRPSLHGLELPSRASIGRYLHQWSQFRRKPKPEPKEIARPNAPTFVHQRWQLDFKINIQLAEKTLVHLHTAYDPVGTACIGARVFVVHSGNPRQRIRMQNVQAFLRACFARWQTLPRQIQTDGETVLAGKPGEGTFPSYFTLWLKGLGIDHLIIRPGKPTDNAGVERCHRTINDYVVVGNENATPEQLQTMLDIALDELAFELPSQAKGCNGQPPAVAHPELCHPPRPFHPEHELAFFDLKRVDRYLATLTWPRRVGTDGRVRLGTQRYFIGLQYARQHVLVSFDPADRHFVFQDCDDPDQVLRRLPAKALEVEDLTGIAAWPFGLGVQQLSLPLPFAKGYIVNEHIGV
jgi:transposase InsO family protein